MPKSKRRPPEFFTYRTERGIGAVVLGPEGVKYHMWPDDWPAVAAVLAATAPDATRVEAAGGQLRTTLEAYFSGARVELGAPLDLTDCRPFARTIYEQVGAIPWGQVRSYQWVARAAGRDNAARAVGRALAVNPVPLFVPCHRVVAARGPGGWSGPPGMKTELLALEGVAL